LNRKTIELKNVPRRTIDIDL